MRFQGVLVLGIVFVTFDSTVVAQEHRGRPDHNHYGRPNQGPNHHSGYHPMGDPNHRRGYQHDTDNQPREERYLKYTEPNHERRGSTLTNLFNPLTYLGNSRYNDGGVGHNNFLPIFNVRFDDDEKENGKDLVEPFPNSNSKDTSIYTDSTNDDIDNTDIRDTDVVADTSDGVEDTDLIADRNSANVYVKPKPKQVKPKGPKTKEKLQEKPTTPKPQDKTDVTPVECEPSVTYMDGEQQCKNQLIFHEQFRTLRRDIWNVEHIFAGAPDYQFVLYIDHPDVIDMKNNNFIISTGRTEDIFGTEVFTDGLDLGSNCTGRAGPPDCKINPEGGFIVPSIVSARLNTRNKFFFKYGKVEIRAKLPSGDWIYPILYLNPSSETYGKYYESGQIRIAFIEGNQNSNNVLKGGVILGDGDLARNYLMKNLTRETSWADTYHTFQLLWKPDSITVSVDGQVYNTIKPPEDGFVSLTEQLKISKAEDWKRGTKLAPFDKEMYLQIGLGIGGLNFPDQNDGSKPWKNRERLMVKKFYAAEEDWLTSWDEGTSALKIDYIKVWAL